MSSERFNSSDAWVFASFRGAIDNKSKINFSTLISVGDSLNRSILTADQIRKAIGKFYRYGIIKIKEETIYFDNSFDYLFEKIDKKRGGLFSVIENTQNVLNSPRIKLEEIDFEAQDFRFINDDFIEFHVKAYLEKTEEIIKSILKSS